MGRRAIRFFGERLKQTGDNNIFDGIWRAGEEFPGCGVGTQLFPEGFQHRRSVILWINGEGDQLHIASYLFELGIELLHTENSDRTRAFAAGKDEVGGPDFTL